MLLTDHVFNHAYGAVLQSDKKGVFRPKSRRIKMRLSQIHDKKIKQQETTTNDSGNSASGFNN